MKKTKHTLAVESASVSDEVILSAMIAKDGGNGYLGGARRRLVSILGGKPGDILPDDIAARFDTLFEPLRRKADAALAKALKDGHKTVAHEGPGVAFAVWTAKGKAANAEAIAAMKARRYTPTDAEKLERAELVFAAAEKRLKALKKS